MSELERHPAVVALVALAGCVFCGASCRSHDGNASDAKKLAEVAKAQITAAEHEVQKAARDVKDYSWAEKTEFVALMQEETAAMDREVDRLAGRIDSYRGSTKAQANAKLKALRRQQANVKKELDKVRNATEAKWEEAKGGLIKARDEMKGSLNDARQWLSEEIAP